MTRKIGIPRALLYYKYCAMWSTFFRELGVDVVISQPTNHSMITHGAARVVSDTCLPVKAYVGHVISLKEKCDYIFIPVLRSTRKRVFNCSRFLGLPDMTRAVLPETPPILEIEIDMNRGRQFLYQQIYNLGRKFGSNPSKIRAAAKLAWNTHISYRERMVTEKLTYAEASDFTRDLIKTLETDTILNHKDPIIIGLIGHPYILSDEHINHRLLKQLKQNGVRLIMPEMLTPEQQQIGLKGITNSTYWVSEEEVIGAGGYYFQRGVDGVIGVMAFGCGPDSLMMHLVQLKARSMNIPFMCLTMEEHTAEAGIITRLEAFVDMVRYRHKEGSNKCLSLSRI